MIAESSSLFHQSDLIFIYIKLIDLGSLYTSQTINLSLRRKKKTKQNGMCAQSDQSLRCLQEESFGP